MPSPTFKPIKPEAIPPKAVGRKPGLKYTPLISRFLESSAVAAEVEPNGVKPSALAGSLKNAARGRGVLIMTRGNRVFLVREKAGAGRER